VVGTMDGDAGAEPDGSDEEAATATQWTEDAGAGRDDGMPAALAMEPTGQPAEEDAVLSHAEPAPKPPAALGTTGTAGAEAATGLSAGSVRRLLAGLSVAPRADGGMVLQADREAAGVLAEVLRGLANAITGAVAGGDGS
jgi:hypothetical protein